MMDYLLDVNVLMAWGWADHPGHLRTAGWIAQSRQQGGNRLFTSAMPELGFVRVSVQRTAGRVTVAAAASVLHGMLQTLGPAHTFLPDDLPSSCSWPPWCAAAARTTDAHLLELARRHHLALATLDEGIPGAFLIP